MFSLKSYFSYLQDVKDLYLYVLNDMKAASCYHQRATMERVRHCLAERHHAEKREHFVCRHRLAGVGVKVHDRFDRVTHIVSQ